MDRIKVVVALSLLFLISVFSLISDVYAFKDDFASFNEEFWGQSPNNTNNAILSFVDGKNCLNMTTNNVTDSKSTVYTFKKFKDVSIIIKFKLENYSYTGLEQTFFAFWFYGDGEFDVEIGFYPDIRDVKISTYCNNKWFENWVKAPPLNDDNWHVLKIDWHFVVSVTIDNSLIIKNWIMPSSPLNFWMGAFSRNGHVFSLYVDYVIIDESSNSSNTNIESYILLFVPLIIVLFFVKVYTK